MLVILLSATSEPVGRLHGEVDGSAVQSTSDVSQPIRWIEG